MSTSYRHHHNYHYHHHHVLTLLVGNKIDIADKQQQPTLRQVTTDEGLELAKQLNVDFVETSALTGMHACM